MQLVIDILLIVVFAATVLKGWRKGFVKSILNLGRLILSVVLTVLFGPQFGAWLDQKFVNPPVYDKVFEKLSEIAADISATADGGVQALVDKIPENFREYLDLENVDPSAKIDTLVEEWSRTVADSISKVIATVLGYVLFFILAFIVLSIVVRIIGKLAKLPFLKTADKILGLILGLVSGVIAVMFISVILSVLLSVIGQEDMVANSFLLNLFAGIKDLIMSKL